MPDRLAVFGGVIADGVLAFWHTTTPNYQPLSTSNFRFVPAHSAPLLRTAKFFWDARHKSPGFSFTFLAIMASKPTTPQEATPIRTILYDVKILPGGAKGSYLQCGNNQLLSYWAPGNIYSQRGTLSFYWRPRDPVDETEFPVFRVGYGDHSSWDMVWLRIDYNGHGFDAFVTDVNLGRTRVSVHDAELSQAERLDPSRACLGRERWHPLLRQR